MDLEGCRGGGGGAGRSAAAVILAGRLNLVLSCRASIFLFDFLDVHFFVCLFPFAPSNLFSPLISCL